MFDTPTESLGTAATLERAAQIHRRSCQLDAHKLEAACHWADLNSSAPDGRALPGAERLVRLGGDGTPAVAEFAPAEFGAMFCEPEHAAAALIGDALDLRHRMPQLWQQVLAGDAKAWIARKAAQSIRHLSLDHAQAVDAKVAPWAARQGAALIGQAEAEALAADPDGAQERAVAAENTQGVWVSPSSELGTKAVFVRTDAASAVLFDAQIDRIADDLQLLGDDSTKDVRRGRAVGVIANPQQALDLRFDAMRAAGHEGPPPPKAGIDARPPAVLYVHVTDQTLAAGSGVARVEGVGPVTADQAKQWLGRCDITVKPVVDLNNQAPADAYEVPDRLREAVHLAIPRDCFPYAVNTSRKTDIDHTTSYDPDGPPGQTAAGKLGPLSRKPHRIKTHGRWQVKQPFPGIFLWRSPHGHMFLVDSTGTRRLGQAA